MADTYDWSCSSCIRGHHVYKDIWQPIIGEELKCVRETNNVRDRYAVAVVKEDSLSSEIVGHLPRKISILSSLFLRHGGTITCVVSGTRSYSSDLPQGGLEVPCTIKATIKKNWKRLNHEQKLINNLVFVFNMYRELDLQPPLLSRFHHLHNCHNHIPSNLHRHCH